MARIRSIKPEFFRDEELQDLEAAHPGCYVMLVFAALWGHCDRNGTFEWRPRQLKLDILPFLPFSMEQALGLLEGAGFVRKYTVSGKPYGTIPTFAKHQRINGKEAQEPAIHPVDNSEAVDKSIPVDKCVDKPKGGISPGESDTYDGEALGKQRGSNGEAVETTGREGKGREVNLETTPTSVTRTTGAGQPAAGVVEGEAPKPKPGNIAAGLSLEALRVTPGVGTDLHDRAGQLWGVLAANGCRGTSSHPAVIEMARQGMTVDALRHAIAETRKSKSGQINPAYIAAVAERLRSEPPTDRGKAAGWRTDDGKADALARELGIRTAKSGEGREQYHARIDQALTDRARSQVA